MPRFAAAAAALALSLAACGGTYVDDDDSYVRALGGVVPEDVELVHSVYWQSPHWTDEHCFYLELRGEGVPRVLEELTERPGIVASDDGEVAVLGTLVVARPEWFAPKPRAEYEVWLSTDDPDELGVLHDPVDGVLFVFGQIL